MVSMNREQIMKAWIAVVALISMLSVAPAWSAQVTADLDRQKVVVGETVTLVLQSNDAQQSLDTDLSALRQDFDIVDQRSETQMSIVNGRQSAVVRLLVTLEPKRPGIVTIPGLKFSGGAATPSMRVEVEPAPELAPGESPPVFIEVELDPIEGPYYVHAQLSLKVRIFYQQNLTEAAINPPAPEQASVRLLDEVPYQADRNGVKFRVLERRYAIFPERSGELVIPPMQLTGRLIERPSDRLWQPSVRGRRVRIESDPMALTVSPRPADYQGDFWLPARKIELSQQISDGDVLQVGEPVTRTVIVDAVGLEEHMLEEPVWPAMENARIYPDQPQGISRDNGEWVLGHREFRYAVVPEVEGELVLPEVRLHWWDTVNHQQRIAVLPEHIVQVKASALAPVNLPTADAGQFGNPGLNGSGGSSGAVTLWQVVSLVFALLWLATLVLYLRRRSPVQSGGKAGGSADQPETELLDELKQSCHKGDIRSVRALMGSWVRRYGPRSAHGSLSTFAGTVDQQELAAAIHSLNAAGFASGETENWDGSVFWNAFEQWRKSSRQVQSAGAEGSFDLYAAAR